MSELRNMEITSLVLLVRARNDFAFDELVERYTPMMNRVISGFREATVTHDEAFSEACVALYRAAESYDLSRTDVTFGLFAKICVYRRLCDFVGKEARSSLLSECDVEEIAAANMIESSLVDRETVQRAIAAARETMSEYEYKIFRLYLAGYTTAEMAKALSMKPKSIDNAKARMFKRLREIGNTFD